MAGNLDPTIGGGARFCSEVIRELFRRGCSSGDQWVVLAEQPASATFSVPAGVSWRQVPRRGLFHRIIGQRPNLLDREVKKLGLSLVWFVGGGGFPEPLECPFLATVWDIQHRTHPFLPEMQTNGEWFYREAKISGFLPRAAAVVTGTREGARQLEAAYGILPEHILIAPHPVPSFFLRAQISPNTPVTPPFFLYPANFWPHKNHATLIRALSLLRQRGQDARLVWTGTGSNQAYLRTLAGEFGVVDRIEFRGHCSDEELAALYDTAVALTYASLSGPENLPPLEAMARGCPVLNSDFPGAREQLADAAVFIPPANAEQWATEMGRFLAPADAASRKMLISAGARLIAGRTVAHYVDRVLAWINEFRPVRNLWP